MPSAVVPSGSRSVTRQPSPRTPSCTSSFDPLDDAGHVAQAEHEHRDPLAHGGRAQTSASPGWMNPVS